MCSSVCLILLCSNRVLQEGSKDMKGGSGERGVKDKSKDEEVCQEERRERLMMWK